MVGRLRDLLSRLTDFRFELLTETAEDGTLVGLITIEKDFSEKVKRSLTDEHIPELSFPQSINNLTFSEKCAYVRKRVLDLNAEIASITRDLEGFSRRWLPIYNRVKEWLDEKLSLLKTSASVFETRMCFFINGWMASRNLEPLRGRLAEAFEGRVALEEKGMHEEDLERVPIILKNPAYFQPFELLVKLLPLPKYTSYDPTPFIGIFFPSFSG
jgi:V/A-type H+-transporting ATPase subunit I